MDLLTNQIGLLLAMIINIIHFFK